MTIPDRVTREASQEEVTFEQTLDVAQQAMWRGDRDEQPGRAAYAKGPEVEMSQVCLKNRRNNKAAGTW